MGDDSMDSAEVDSDIVRRYPELTRLTDGVLRRKRLIRAMAAWRARIDSQASVADRIGSTQPALARLEQGKVDPRVSTLERYAAALNANFVWQVVSDTGRPVSEDFEWAPNASFRAVDPIEEIGGVGVVSAERINEFVGSSEVDDVLLQRYPELPRLFSAVARRKTLLKALAAWRVRIAPQEVVAKRMGSTQPALARLENGKVDPKLSTLERYAAALDSNFIWQIVNDEGVPVTSELKWAAEVYSLEQRSAVTKTTASASDLSRENVRVEQDSKNSETLREAQFEVEVDPEALDTFVSLVRRHPVEEAQRRLLRLGIPPARVSAIRRAYEDMARHLKELRDPPSLDAKNSDLPWYVGPDNDDRFWHAIVDLLTRREWDDDDVKNLDIASTKVLARMRHPQTDRFTTRGLVIGHVQSGKTSNFTSVIAKAADRDYRFFIVLSGVHNSLREQTQERLDNDLVSPNPEYWLPLTGPNKDFIAPENATVYLSRVGEHHVLCVIKKNAMRLRRLRDWLRTAQSTALKECPVVIIDDEADQASVATPTINGLIRDILNLLPRAAYIGYTATPFANLLIDPSAKDLYPSDFIIDLPQPADHFSTEVIFGRDAVESEVGEGPLDGYDMVRIVPLDELPHLRPAPKQSADEFTPEITASLRRAILYYWLATAVRKVRGTGVPHSTMLIHTSMRIAVHESFREPIEILRAEVVRKLASDDRALLEELRTIWQEETGRVPAATFDEVPVTFVELRKRLAEVVGATRVVMDNSRSRERLSYLGGEPVVAIAVGGNTLSRGLTLEGLVVSYFVRSASAYDTLLQMGRWFGYRRGYPDLPRIWMTQELQTWFRHIALVEMEIRRDIRRYEEENLTPQDFAVRIRTHPALTITAASKMRDAVRAEASYGGKRVQTRYFPAQNRDWLRDNIGAAKQLVGDAIEIDGANLERKPAGEVVIRDVKADSVIKFLRSYKVHEATFDLDPTLVERYIRKQNDKGRLLHWNVVLVAGEPESDLKPFEFGHGLSVKRIRRSKLLQGPAEYADIKTLMSKEHRVIDLAETTQSEARRKTETQLMQMRQPDYPGLVALYAIDRTSHPDEQNKDTRIDLDAADDVVGLGMVFPGTGAEEPVTYMSADLSRLGMSADEIEQPEEEDPEPEVAASG